MAEDKAEKSLMNKDNQLVSTQDVLPQDYNKRIEEAKRQNKALMELMDELLEEGTDYGKEKGIPRPFLHQPGAQQLCLVFKFQPRLEKIDSEINFSIEPTFVSYEFKCKLYQRETEQFMGEGVGSCNNYEKKYRYHADGSLFEDPLDRQNTLMKMAKKRAFVDAVLNVTGAARLFTQDQDLVKYEESGKNQSTKVTNPADYEMPFGKHKGKKLKNIDESYLEWMADNFEPKNDTGEKAQTVIQEYLKENKEKQENQISKREKEIKKLIDDNEEMKKELMDYLRYIRDEKELKEITINDLEKEEYQELKDILLKFKKMAS